MFADRCYKQLFHTGSHVHSRQQSSPSGHYLSCQGNCPPIAFDVSYVLDFVNWQDSDDTNVELKVIDKDFAALFTGSGIEYALMPVDIR